MNDIDKKYLRLSFQVAVEAYEKGNHPFGAVLVDEDGNELLRAGNTIEEDNDTTAHAETNLLRMAWEKYTQDFLKTCTLYSSAEPCVMCSGTIYWSGVGRTVFGIDIYRQAELSKEPQDFAPVFECRDIVKKGKKDYMRVEGPFLEDEAEKVFMTEPK